MGGAHYNHELRKNTSFKKENKLIKDVVNKGGWKDSVNPSLRYTISTIITQIIMLATKIHINTPLPLI
ncbi:hypothetical protein C7T89_08290 [Clostridium sp. NJ4]|nr:hypothetical protein DK921_08295 [Clostridium acetobutylicum]PSM05894.1 hypothetical protein C7T89_08290 [Clostridium sp. NJ4]